VPRCAALRRAAPRRAAPRRTAPRRAAPRRAAPRRAAAPPTPLPAQCAVSAKAPKEYKVGACHKGTLYTCVSDAAGATSANESSYNDDTCTSYNSSKLFKSGACTQTGPKTARTSKLLTCL